MGRYDNNLKCAELRRLLEARNYKKAYQILETIDLGMVRNVTDLNAFAEVYRKAGKYDAAKEMLELVYARTRSRMTLYKLANLAVLRKDFEEAEKLLAEYIEKSPEGEEPYVLRYRIEKAKGADYLTRIACLEQLRAYEYIEEWAYELATLYHKQAKVYHNEGNYEQEAQMIGKCVEECSDIVLWFGEGVIVEKAKLLRMYHLEGSDALERYGVDLEHARKRADEKTRMSRQDARMSTMELAEQIREFKEAERKSEIRKELAKELLPTMDIQQAMKRDLNIGETADVQEEISRMLEEQEKKDKTRDADVLIFEADGKEFTKNIKAALDAEAPSHTEKRKGLFRRKKKEENRQEDSREDFWKEEASQENDMTVAEQEDALDTPVQETQDGFSESESMKRREQPDVPGHKPAEESSQWNAQETGVDEASQWGAQESVANGNSWWNKQESGRKESSQWNVQETGVDEASQWGAQESGANGNSWWNKQESGRKESSQWNAQEAGVDEASQWGAQESGVNNVSQWNTQRSGINEAGQMENPGEDEWGWNIDSEEAVWSGLDSVESMIVQKKNNQDSSVIPVEEIKAALSGLSKEVKLSFESMPEDDDEEFEQKTAELEDDKPIAKPEIKIHYGERYKEFAGDWAPQEEESVQSGLEAASAEENQMAAARDDEDVESGLESEWAEGKASDSVNEEIAEERLSEESLSQDVEDEESERPVRAGVDLEKNFSGFMHHYSIRKQIINVFTEMEQHEDWKKHFIITGDPKTGKTTLARKLARVMNKMGAIKQAKFAKTTGSEINKMNLEEKKERLKGACLIIEEAGDMYLPTIRSLKKIMEEYEGNFVVILEDGPNAIERFLLENYDLQDYFHFIFRL